MQQIELTLKNLQTHYLVSAIFNALASAGGTIAVLLGGLATCGIGCLLIVLPMVNLGVMIFDLVALSRLKQPPNPGHYSFLRLTAIFEMCAGLAIVPLVMGVLSLQTLGRPEVYAHYHPAAGGRAD